VDGAFHESDDRLELYALGRLSDSDLIGIEEHLMVCDSCRDRLDETADLAFAIREGLRNNPVPDRTGRARWFQWLNPRPQFALAGVLALAILAVVFTWNGNEHLAPVATLQLTAMRGAGVPAVRRARELDITFGDADAASGIEVVNGSGATVWSGAPAISGGSVVAKVVKAFSQGEYFVRIYDSPGHMLHEYGFSVK